MACEFRWEAVYFLFYTDAYLKLYEQKGPKRARALPSRSYQGGRPTLDPPAADAALIE